MGAQDDDLARRRAALDERLRARQEAESAERSNPARSDMARGLKLSSEFIAGVIVGALLGYLFDLVAGTSPFGLIVFLMLGFAAGVLNVLRETGRVAEPGQRMAAANAHGGTGSGRGPVTGREAGSDKETGPGKEAGAAKGGSRPTGVNDGPGAGDPAMYDDDD